MNKIRSKIHAIIIDCLLVGAGHQGRTLLIQFIDTVA